MTKLERIRELMNGLTHEHDLPPHDTRKEAESYRVCVLCQLTAIIEQDKEGLDLWKEAAAEIRSLREKVEAVRKLSEEEKWAAVPKYRILAILDAKEKP